MFNRIQKLLLAGAGIAALALGGSAIAGAASSSSGSTTTQSGSGTTQSAPAPPQGARPNFPAHGTASHEDAEKPVTGTAADQAKAAAIKSLGGGTAGEVTSDFTGDGYEVTVTKSDGTQTEVHLDKAFNVMQGPGGGHHGPPPAGG